MVKALAYAVGLALVLPVSPLAAEAESGPVATETFLIPSADPAIKIYLRNRHLSGREKFGGDRIVLFVHGATYPAETAFDIDLPGGSWMEYAARRGYDAWLVDVRGYGGSTRPAAMDAPPDKNPPFATTAEAIQDVGSAVDFILKRRARGDCVAFRRIGRRRSAPSPRSRSGGRQTWRRIRWARPRPRPCFGRRTASSRTS
jgi:pimeloyl-ACP methyl ester carboxylesterase